MREKRVIKVSVLSAVLFSFIGIGWGILSGSSMILFDGVYSFISVILSMASLLVANTINEKEESKRFPLGKAHLEPFLIVMKSLVLITTCLYSISMGVIDIMDGGHLVYASDTISYATFSTLGCWVTLIYIRKRNVSLQSNIVKIEGDQWYGDTLLSLGVLVGFLLSEVLGYLGVTSILKYIDSSLVIIASTFFLLIPLKSLFYNMREVLLLRPKKRFIEPFDRLASTIAKEQGSEYKLKVVKQGRELYIEYILLFTDNRSFSIEEMAKIKQQFASLFEGRYAISVHLDLDFK